MQIGAISSTRFNSVNNYSRNGITSPNFRGALSDKTIVRVLDMLKPQVTSTRICSSLNDVKPALDSLAVKYDAAAANRGIGCTIIPDDMLAGFMGQDAAKYNLKELKGLVFAAGDKNGPVETWSKAFEAQLLLVPKKIFN